MVTDQQVKRLWRFRRKQLSLEVAAAKAGMDVKTARKYLRDPRLPRDMKQSMCGGRGRIPSRKSGRSCGNT
jgi:hypothetical protein